jgi:riboflavin kinase/FMN adenylyltransferase
MIILNNCFERISDTTVITIGTFDGVHKGHQKILKRLENVKQEKKLKSIVFTFYPHPRKIVQQYPEIKLLSTKDEKIQLLQQYRIDYLMFCPFTKEFSNMEPDDFVKYLADCFHIKHVIIGYNHRFGKERKGDVHTFISLQSQYGFEVEQIPAETINEIDISSTKIRNYLMKGDIEQANQLLGYSYFLKGKVIEGKKLGRSIGIPTANIQIEDRDKLIPPNGVYCVDVIVNKKQYKGVMNIGVNPTTDHDFSQKIEVHILNFNDDIYHQEIEVRFIKRIRDEIKFASIDALKNQILKDIQECSL